MSETAFQNDISSIFQNGLSNVQQDAQRSVAQETALYVGAFFDELSRCGVREVVISPGSRSTALAMVAFELSCREPEKMQIYVDVDERGASFFALGLAKASGRPVCLVCTSGTALANYYPAVMEAETSRVPLIVLSADRPLRLQGLGAPQTVDQLKAYGNHVRAFRQMPLPGADDRDIAFVRQAAREACFAALGVAAIAQSGAAQVRDGAHSQMGGQAGAGACGNAPAQGNADELGCADATGCTGASGYAGASDCVIASRGCRYMAGPVQLNFQFDEPLTPDLSVEGLFAHGRAPEHLCDGKLLLQMPFAPVKQAVDEVFSAQLRDALRGRRVMLLAGEGTCETVQEAREVISWASRSGVVLLADILSGLRSFDDEVIVENYDNVFGLDACPLPDVVVRFGRYPVSKRCARRLAQARPFNVVVDVAETRDFNMATDVFVPCTPLDFVRSLDGVAADVAFLQEWTLLNNQARKAIEDAQVLPGKAAEAERLDASGNLTGHEQLAVSSQSAEVNRLDASAQVADAGQLAKLEQPAEGAFVGALLRLAPEGSCVFSANSMSVRLLDAAYVKGDKRLAVLCNRGQNGIDGTVSTALGAAQHYEQTTFLTGDFTMLHDLNALALQRELRMHHGGGAARSIVVVLLNNNGGGIFDVLPQKSEADYFERLFVVPQDVRFEHAACAFGVPYRAVSTVTEFEEAYCAFLGTPGISFIEVKLPYEGTKERYALYQSL